MRGAIIEATDLALKNPVQERFLRTERGYQGIFYAHLLSNLMERGIVDQGRILEMEYQKRNLHRVSRQRPDIILHVPIEYSEEGVEENNFCVWALKWHGTEQVAADDFDKLNAMIAKLRYRVGIFVNIDSREHHADIYEGPFADQVHCVAVWFDGEMKTAWGRPRRADGN